MAALHFQFMLQKVLPCRKYITYVELNNIVRIIKENADLCTGLWTCSQFDVFLRYARKIIKLCESCFISSNVCLLDINNKIYQRHYDHTKCHQLLVRSREPLSF